MGGEASETKQIGKVMKSLDQIMNTTKFQSLQNSWMADEASELRNKAA